MVNCTMLIENNIYLILSYLILSYLILSYLILSYLILSYLILSYLILSYLILSYLILSYLILSYLILSYLILSYLILSYLILSYLILHPGVLERHFSWNCFYNTDIFFPFASHFKSSSSTTSRELRQWLVVDEDDNGKFSSVSPPQHTTLSG